MARPSTWYPRPLPTTHAAPSRSARASHCACFLGKLKGRWDDAGVPCGCGVPGRIGLRPATYPQESRMTVSPVSPNSTTAASTVQPHHHRHGGGKDRMADVAKALDMSTDDLKSALKS